MALTQATPFVTPRLLGHWSDEARLTALLFLLSFVATGIPRLFTSTASHTLFLEQYGANAMPFAYLGQAVVVPIVGQLFLRAQARLGLRELMVGTLVADLIVLVLLRLGLTLSDAPVVSLAAVVWFEVEFALSGLVLWGLANQLMTLRQGKRLYGFVGAGEPVAIVLLGLFTPWLLRWIEPADLFLISALGVAAGVPLVLRLTRGLRLDVERGPAAHAEAQRTTGRVWSGSYVLAMVAVVIAAQMTYFLIDNAFYLEAADRYPDERELGGFLGLYNAGVGLISLGTTMLVSGPFVHRFGVRAGLLVLPVLLVVGSTVVVASGYQLGVGPILFWMVLSNKLTDQSLRHTLSATTSVVLYQPLPATQRIRVQTALEIIVEPLTGGVAGVALLLLMPLLKFDGVSLTYVILVFAVGWAGLVLFQHRLYLKALHSALLNHRLGSGRVRVEDEASRAVIRRGLLSGRPEEVIYCLRLLDDAGEPIGTHLVTLIDHAAPEVRIEALRRLAREPVAGAQPTLERRLAGETEPRVRAALLPALAAVGASGSIDTLARFLDDPDEVVRLGAFVALLRHGGIEGVLEAGEPFLEALRSSRPEDRRFAALVLAEVGSQQWYRPLLALLTDDDEAVRVAALRAARTIRAPAVWPAIVDNLADPFDGRAAVTALAAIGDPILPLLDRAFDQPQDDAARTALVRRRIVAVWARIPSHPASWRLIERLGFPDRAVRRAAQSALGQRRFQAPPATRPEVLDHLRAATASAIWGLGAWTDLEDLSGSVPVELVRRALARQIDDDLESIFTLLGFLYPPAAIEAATENYFYGDERRRAYALEILDNLLDREFKPLVLPLIEGRTPEQKLAGLSMRDRPAHLSASLRLSDILAQPSGRLTRWALGCAIYAGVRHLSGGGGDYFDPLADDVGAGFNATPGTAVMMITIEKVLVLRTAGIFSAMQEEYLADVAERAREVELAAGETLFREGELGTTMYLITRGRLRVERDGQTLAELGDGEVVGEMSAVDPEARSATVLALEPSTLLCIDHSDIQILLAEDPEVARGIIQVLCRRLRQTTGL